MLAGQPAEAQPYARGCLQQQSTDMRLLLSLAAQFDRILSFDLNSAERLSVDETNDRPEEEIGTDDEGSGQHACDELTGSCEHSNHRRAPEGRGGVETANIDAFPQDYANTEETYPGDLNR